MNTIFRTTMALAVAATLFTGCSVEDLEDGENFANESSTDGSSYDDVISIAKTNKDFKVTWIKNNSGYGEVIYKGGSGDSYSRKALTANGSGVITFDCEFSNEDNGEAVYSCQASNLAGDYAWKILHMKEGVQYEWYPTYGFDHEEGEVDATTEYSNDLLTVE